MQRENPSVQPAMQLRVARHTERLQQVVGFYRDGIGLIEIEGFRDHDGYDGVFLAVPGTDAHLELTTGDGHGTPVPHPESLLVLYLGDPEVMRYYPRPKNRDEASAWIAWNQRLYRKHGYGLWLLSHCGPPASSSVTAA
jgi:hypothetical protein